MIRKPVSIYKILSTSLSTGLSTDNHLSYQQYNSMIYNQLINLFTLYIELFYNRHLCYRTIEVYKYPIQDFPIHLYPQSTLYISQFYYTLL